jgi:hypothetical protein
MHLDVSIQGWQLAAYPIDHYLALAPKAIGRGSFCAEIPTTSALRGAHSEMVQLGTAGDVIPVFFLHSQQEAVRHWRSAPFADPIVSAKTASIFWSAAYLQSSLPVLARCVC